MPHNTKKGELGTGFVKNSVLGSEVAQTNRGFCHVDQYCQTAIVYAAI